MWLQSAGTLLIMVHGLLARTDRRELKAIRESAQMGAQEAEQSSAF